MGNGRLRGRGGISLLPIPVRGSRPTVVVQMTIGKGKRPRDPNQLAKWIVDQSTSGQPSEPESIVTPTAPMPPADMSQYMAAIGRRGGLIGGKRRLATMTKRKRSQRPVPLARCNLAASNRHWRHLAEVRCHCTRHNQGRIL